MLKRTTMITPDRTGTVLPLSTTQDPELAAALVQVDDLERRMVLAFEERMTGVSVDEVARQRPAVVAQATAICAALRDEIRERFNRRPRP